MTTSHNHQQDIQLTNLLINKTNIQKRMKKSYIALIVLGVVAIYGVSTYNGMVRLDEEVSTKWSNVESQYQRRSDLIPNLVATVKGYATHEQGTLDSVISARAEATQTKIDISNATPEQLANFQKVQGSLSSALSRLMAVSESYPELKANENFKELQSQLEGTENRINVVRKEFNAAAQTYNTEIRQFPGTIVASVFGFKTRAYFEADEGAEKATEVKF